MEIGSDSTEMPGVDMNKKEPFRAGAAQVDITPMLGTRMNGDFISHYATSIHDPFFQKHWL